MGRRESTDALSKITPGQAAHNAWCAEDDWAELDSESRDLWEAAAQAAIAAAGCLVIARPTGDAR